MILCEVTINAVLNRVSNEYIGTLTNPWHRRILSFDPLTLGIYNDYGGYMKFDTGSIAFSPELFENDWPPPTSCPLTVKYTATTEAAAETVLTANLHIEEITREQILYGIYRDTYATVLADATAFTAASGVDSLTDVFTWACDASRLNLTLDTTLARSPSPAVEYTTAGERLLIDFLDEIAAFYTHMFYISGSTLYLIDMKDQDNGSRTLTEYQFFPLRYLYRPPVAIARAGDYSQVSSYAYGTDLSLTAFHDTQANIETALADILTMANRARAELPIPFAGDIPDPAEKIAFPDTSNIADLSTYIRTRALTYDFDNEEVLIEGDGVISAA